MSGRSIVNTLLWWSNLDPLIMHVQLLMQNNLFTAIQLFMDEQEHGFLTCIMCVTLCDNMSCVLCADGMSGAASPDTQTETDSFEFARKLAWIGYF